MTVKLVDLDSFIHYHEIQFLHRTQDHLFGDMTTSSANKRNTIDLAEHNDDPIMDDIEFTDLAMTDEMEGFLKRECFIIFIICGFLSRRCVVVVVDGSF